MVAHFAWLFNKMICQQKDLRLTRYPTDYVLLHNYGQLCLLSATTASKAFGIAGDTLASFRFAYPRI